VRCKRLRDNEILGERAQLVEESLTQHHDRRKDLLAARITAVSLQWAIRFASVTLPVESIGASGMLVSLYNRLCQERWRKAFAALMTSSLADSIFHC